MACDITRARPLDCKDQVGGIKMVYFMKYDATYYSKIDFNGTTATSEQIDGFDTGAAGTFELFGYAVRQNTGAFTSTITASPENGTTFFESVLNLTLNKLTVQDQKELRILTYGRVITFVLDNQDNLWSIGWQYGCDVTGGTMVSGTAKGDLTGYTLDIRGQDRNLPYFLKPTLGSGTAKYPFDQMADIDDITVTLVNA